jgi:uncharacterized membrane protein
MSHSIKKMMLGAVIAGILGAAAAASADPGPAKEHCDGVKSCKIHGACAGANNSCSGQNGCKGQGWVAMPKASCEGVGGSLKPAK